MQVYVVTAGYDCEGSGVIGVYSSYLLAQQCVDMIESDYDFCDIDEYTIDY